MEPWAAARKSFKLEYRCHQLLSGFLAKGHLPRVSRQLPLSANDKGDNKIISGAVHRSTNIYPTAEKNSGKSQLGDRLMKAVRSVIASYGVPYLQMRSVGIISIIIIIIIIIIIEHLRTWIK